MKDDMNAHPASASALQRLARASRTAYAAKGWYLATVAGVFACTVALAAALDLLPERAAAEQLAAAPALVTAPVQVTAPELPTEIEIPALERTIQIENPVTTDIATLDRALLRGIVRYPTSAKLGEDGNVILFGHSSYLPVVRNPMFKAFNGIENLEKGERIIVRGSGHEFVYAVETVVQADANADAIPLAVEGRKLTLATCDSFGTPSDRFIVTATLVETRAL